MGKILITGASGFIGSHLVDYLLGVGENPSRLRLFVPPWETLDNLPQDKLDVFIGDIRDGEAVMQATQGVEIIYHLAAKTIVDKGTYGYYKDVNVGGTENVLKAARLRKIKKLIYFSSISVFGLPAWRGDMININETYPKKPSEAYGRTKLEAEKKVIRASKKWDIPYIIIRPTTVYGPRDRAGIFQLYQAIKKNIFFFIGSGENKMDYVYVKDLVRAARLAEKSDIENEDFIIGLANPITQKEIVSSMCEVLDKNVPKFHLSTFIALSMSYIVRALSDMFKIKPLVYPQRVKVLTTNCYFDSSKAQFLLDYYPKHSLKEGIKKTIKWVKRKSHSK